MTAHDARVTRTFVEFADTLVADFDLVEFLHVLTVRCAELLAVDAAGLLLADADGVLAAVAASDDQARLLELLQLQTQEGAAIDCFRTGQAVQCADLGRVPPQWPVFAQAAAGAGFSSVIAVPMRLRDEVIGAVNLFDRTARTLSEDDLGIGQALADMATIGILHERAFRRQGVLVDQLQRALTSRIITEQAKGVLAERLGVGVGEAFTALRSHARRTQRRLADVAAAVVEGGPDGGDLVATYRSRR
jgi:transcriptional regulator with GAF, ATPase, and Fis domain